MDTYIDDSFDGHFHEDAPLNGEVMNGGGSAMEIITRVELDLAYSSEKLLILEILLMEVAGRARDIESHTLENEEVAENSVEMAFEYDILSGILNSEVKELECFMTSLQMEILDAHQRVGEGESSGKLEEKLCNAESSLKQLRGLLEYAKNESAKIESAVDLFRNKSWPIEDRENENGDLPSKDAKWKTLTANQQRHALQMLERSLARELDLDKQLADSKTIEDELKSKLHHVEREFYYTEELVDIILERMFKAENAAELLLGISKELAGNLNAVQFNLSSSPCRESEIKSKLQESMVKLTEKDSALQKLKASLKEAEDNCMHSSSEVLTLKEKVSALKEQLRVSNVQLQSSKVFAETTQEKNNMLHLELSKLESMVEGLEENISRAESRAENSEEISTELHNANLELNQELYILRGRGSEKANFLDQKLKESGTQLEHAKASIEAIVDQQNMLKSTISDMEHVIEDLKGKVLKAETRAEGAESKCMMLNETNLELNEEIGFLRSRIEMLEDTLHRADHAKVSTAKDIGVKTKLIADLVTKLALERERLHLQIMALTRKNKILEQNCKRNSYAGTTMAFDNKDKFETGKSHEEALTESSSTYTQVKVAAVPVSEIEVEKTMSAEDESAADSNSETVRTIEPSRSNWKYIFTAIIMVFASALAYCLYQGESIEV